MVFLPQQVRREVDKVQGAVHLSSKKLSASCSPSASGQQNMREHAVTFSIIGADFLTHFNVLVDLRRQKLVDEVTQMSMYC